MSVAELSTFKWKCDGCGKTATVKAQFRIKPRGWTSVSIPDDKSYRYYDYDYCPKCTKKQEKK